MKTFSLAFILGVFVGALVTAYFGSPNSYQNLLAAKAELLGEEALREETLASPDPEEPAPEPTAPAEQNPPAQVPVQPEPLPEPPSDAPPEAPPAEQPAPAPADDPQPEEPQSEPTPDPVPSPQPEDVPEASPQPTPDQPSEPDPDLETLTEKARRAIGSGAEKAAELAETAKEKSATLREDAEPYLERGVDIGIAATIRAQFKLDRRIDSDAIAIDVKNRAVHLTGKVPTSKIKQLVIETAMGTKGVSQVTEELSVEP